MFLYIKFSIEVGEKAQSPEPDSWLWVPEWETQHPWKIWAQWYILHNNRILTKKKMPLILQLKQWDSICAFPHLEVVRGESSNPIPYASTTHSLPTEPSSPLPHMLLFWYLFPILLYLSIVPYSAIAMWFCVCYNMSSSMLWMYMTYINYLFIHLVLGVVFWS